MPLFFTEEPRKLGHRADILTMSTLTVDENRLWYAKLKDEGARIIEPPLVDTLKSKVLPQLTIPASNFDPTIGVGVHPLYISVLKWIVKRDFYEHKALGDKTKEGYKKLDASIRHHLVKLISYVEHDEDGNPIPGARALDLSTSVLELRNLHALLEKFDLGRRKDLNVLYPVTAESMAKTRRLSRIDKKERDRDIRFAEAEREAAYQDAFKTSDSIGTKEAPVIKGRPWLRDMGRPID